MTVFILVYLIHNVIFLEQVVVSDLLESEATSAAELRSIIDTGFRNRTTHATESNDESSRSHAICQVSISERNKEIGRLSLIGKI